MNLLKFSYLKIKSLSKKKYFTKPSSNKLDLIKYMGFSVLCTIIYLSFIPHRSSCLTGWYSLSMDAEMYIKMVNKGIASIPSPYRYRILIPIFLSLISKDGEFLLKITSLISICLTIFIFLKLTDLIKTEQKVKLQSTLIVISTTTFLLQFQNLQLIDSFNLLVISMTLYSFIFYPNKLIIAVLITLGILSKESFIFIIPTIVLLKEKKILKIILFLYALFLFFAPRYILSFGQPNYFTSYLTEFKGYGINDIVKLFFCFNSVWILGNVGMFFIEYKNFKIIMSMFILTLTGLLFSFLFVTDVTRLMVFLSPYFVISLTSIITEIRKIFPKFYSAIVLLLILNIFIGIPNYFTHYFWTGIRNMTELENYYNHFISVITIYNLTSLIFIIYLTYHLVKKEKKKLMTTLYLLRTNIKNVYHSLCIRMSSKSWF